MRHKRPATVKICEVNTPAHPRSIRSFVTRAGRTTAAQQRALDELWPAYGVEFSAAPLDAIITRLPRGNGRRSVSCSQ